MARSRRTKLRNRKTDDSRKERGYQVQARKPKWIDTVIGVRGTIPEKMVIQEMIRREIPFYFQYNMPDFADTEEVESWRIDVYIPSTKICLEVNGDYWHTLGDRPFKDAYKYAVLEAHGYKVVVWWESEILTKLFDLFASEPLLNFPPVKGPPVHLEYNTDDAAAVRSANAKRRRPVSASTSRSSRRRKRRVRS